MADIQDIIRLVNVVLPVDEVPVIAEVVPFAEVPVVVVDEAIKGKYQNIKREYSL